MAATGGTYTVTQGATTSGSIAYNATIATIQTAFDTAFGSGQFGIISWNFPSGGGQGFIALGRGSNAATTTALTINGGSLTGGSATVSQFLGDIAAAKPTDGAGRDLPFVIVLAAGHNDSLDNNASYTTAMLLSTVQALIAGLQTKFPTAIIVMTGSLFAQPSPDSNVTNSNAALVTASASLATVNGATPFVDVLGQSYFSGTGSVFSPNSSGNTDRYFGTFADAPTAVHPSQAGHEYLGRRAAGDFMKNSIGGGY